MKSLGITAVIALVLSFICWAIQRSYWVYEAHIAAPGGYESRNAIRNVMEIVAAFSMVMEYLAILLIAIAVIMATKRLPKE